MAEIPVKENTREFRSTPYANIDTNRGRYTRRTTQMLASGLNQIGSSLKQMDEEDGKIEAAKMSAQMRNDVAALMIEAQGTSKDGTINDVTLSKLQSLSPVIRKDSLRGKTIQDAVTQVEMDYDAYASNNLSKTGHKKFADSNIDTSATNNIKAHVMYRGIKTKNMEYKAANSYGEASKDIAKAASPIASGFAGDDSVEETFNNLSDNAYITPLNNEKMRDAAYTQVAMSSLAAATRKGQYEAVLSQLGMTSKDFKEASPETLDKFGVYWDVEGNTLKAKDGTIINTDTIDVMGKVDKLKGMSKLDPKVRERAIQAVMSGMTSRAKQDMSKQQANAEASLHRASIGPMTPQEEQKVRSQLAEFVQNPNFSEAKRVEVATKYHALKLFSNSAASIPMASLTDIADGKKQLQKELNSMSKEQMFGDKLNDPSFKMYVDSPAFMSKIKAEVVARYDAAVTKDRSDRAADIAAYVFKHDGSMGRMFKAISSSAARQTALENELADTRSKGGTLSQTKLDHLKNLRKTSMIPSLLYTETMRKSQEAMGVEPKDVSYIPKSMVARIDGNIKHNMDNGDLAGTMKAYNQMSSLIGLDAPNAAPELKNDYLKNSKSSLIIHATTRINNPILRAKVLNLAAQKKSIKKQLGISKLDTTMQQAINSDSLVLNTVQNLLGNRARTDGVYLSGMIKEAVSTLALRDISEESDIKSAVEAAAKEIIPSITSIHDTRGINGSFPVTTDAVKNIGMSATDIANGVGVFNNKIKTAKVKFLPSTLDSRARIKAGTLDTTFKQLPKEDQESIERGLRMNVTPVMLTDGTLEFRDAVTNAPVPVKLMDGDEYSYKVAPAHFSSYISEQDVLDFKDTSPLREQAGMGVNMNIR